MSSVKNERFVTVSHGSYQCQVASVPINKLANLHKVNLALGWLKKT